MSPLRRVWIGSPNYSSRGSGVRLIVVHTAEGALTYQSLGNFFANPSSGVSSHTGIDDTPGTIGEYVRRENKAWTQGNANPYSVATELCAFAAWTPAQWGQHQVMLSNCAQWIAEEAAHFQIPVRRLSAAEAQGGASGVCGHNELGASGGGHWDPGPSFPWDDVLRMAQGGAGPAPAQEEEGNMIASTPEGKGYWTTTRDGAIYAFGNAEFHGGANTGHLPKGRRIVGIAGDKNTGYWLLSDAGDLYAYGSANFMGKPDRVM